MGASDERLLRVERGADGVTLRLLAPGVGLFTDAVPRGHVLVPGQRAGTLRLLERSIALIVPPDALGVVRNERPERVHAPVGWGDLLYELDRDPALVATSDAEQAPSAEGVRGLVFRSPQAGRFYHRASPQDPPLVGPGSRVAEGTALGLIEVMKTFAQVSYVPAGGLPTVAQVVRHLVEDGAEVAEGEPLIELEPARE